VTGIHGATALAAVAVLGAMGVAAGALALLDRESRILEWARRVALGLLVAEAALGLAAAIRGGRPSEGIHWLYGGVILIVLLIPGGVAPELRPRARSGALALGSGIASAVAWRLWASG
jgi:heme A synthase